MPNRMSVPTIDSPEFINIKGINPMVSKCECKVFYLGHNRNGSHIDKTVAAQMAQTLPGCMIVGYFSENKDDFRDHGRQVIIDGDGVKFKCQTTPYGFVAPDTKVWFKDFEDTDEFGNKVIRTYLMTECYLWTGHFEEAMRVYNEGRPHSMELDDETLKGFWSTDNNCGMDFFIINDAIFSKLCILGNDVEPCFEGSDITSPKVSSSFTLDSNFKTTLYNMMEELKELTNSTLEKGEKQMDTEKEFVNVQDAATPEAAPAAEPVAPEVAPEAKTEEAPKEEIEKNSEIADKLNSEINSEIQNTTEEFKKKEDSEEKNSSNEDDKESNSKSDDETGKEEDNKDSEEEDDKKKKAPTKATLEEVEAKYALLEQQYNELQDKFSALEEQNKELNEFKLKVEDQEKDDLINSFYMLSNEDKKNVIENKSKFTLDEIKKELSVICFDKKVSFTKEDKKEKEIETPTIFNLNDSVNSDLPAWLKAVEDNRNKN